MNKIKQFLSKYKIILLVIILVILFSGIFIYAKNMTNKKLVNLGSETKKIPQECEFTVEHYFGAVNDSNIELLGKIKATDAEDAAKKFMTTEQKGWSMQDPENGDTQNRFYVEFYNPMSAVSDKIDKITARCIMNFMQEFTIRKGETVEIVDGFKITFKEHSHKRTSVGQESPLVVYMGYTAESEYHTVYPGADGSFSWQWRDYNFFVSDWGYDEYMTLKVGKIP